MNHLIMEGTNTKKQCPTLMGVRGIVADRGLAGTRLGLVGETAPGPGLVGLEKKQTKVAENVHSGVCTFVKKKCLHFNCKS